MVKIGISTKKNRRTNMTPPLTEHTARKSRRGIRPGSGNSASTTSQPTMKSMAPRPVSTARPNVFLN